MKLANKVAIITGAASGQGQAAAVLFAKEGAKVVAADINQDGLRRTEALVAEVGGRILTSVTDVSSSTQVQAMVEASVSAFGGVHAVYNNAGLLHPKDGYLTDVDEELWDRVLDINLKGMFLVCKYAIPVMLKSGGGAIVNTSSSGGLKAGGSTAYGASKGGVIALTRNIAKQYAPKIRANSICPGPIDTPMMVVARNKAGPKRSSLSDTGGGTMLGRMGQPVEVAQLALYLLSDDASFITGANISVDGGLVSQ